MALEPAEAARPYAEAAYGHARGADAVAQWQELLGALAAAVADGELMDRLHDPRIGAAQAEESFAAVAAALAADAGAQAEPFSNFCRQLHANERLAAAGEIVRLYAELRNKAEKRLEAEIRTAFPVDKKTEKEVAAKLRAQHGVDEVKLTVTVDEELVGGMMVIAGDSVIDGSVTAELGQLRTALLR
ncbi:MAG: F0F1 ATP synthase subunit delta [Betaproteobacteria bacterium AqS2]|uniref:ATP synthase subunit delta n=1 Tax=Candidatus Amphirhobacter heronislandensis TaxID=1732024 RepID=A0A930UDU9_9GAMM|nr:F0F1 ATP synthase subunit delta [Betaproteobacteria bacterium AqS2]